MNQHKNILFGSIALSFCFDDDVVVLLVVLVVVVVVVLVVVVVVVVDDVVVVKFKCWKSFNMSLKLYQVTLFVSV